MFRIKKSFIGHRVYVRFNRKKFIDLNENTTDLEMEFLKEIGHPAIEKIKIKKSKSKA